MMWTTYEAIQDLLVHLEGWNPLVRARLIAEARLDEQEPDPRGRLVSENPYYQDHADR